MSNTIFSVKYLSQILDEVIRGSLFHNIYLRGEIQSKNVKGKYTYLTLIDSEDDGNVQASMTVLVSEYSRVQSKEYDVGDTVLLKGSLAYYKQRGTVSFWADYLIIDGEGKELVRLKKLKEKLEKEGLFAHEHKKELPLYPKCVGVITSSSGAAIQDVKSTLKKRYPVKIKVFSAIVQGLEASKSLYKELNNAMNDEEVDVILITRGGGSKADLAPFNDEKVARLIYSSKIPVISAVGHQIDTSITDLVADKTAITPTDAANLISFSLTELAERRFNAKNELKTLLKYNYENKLQQFHNYVLQLENLSPSTRINNLKSKLQQYEENLKQGLSNTLKEKRVLFDKNKDELNLLFKNILNSKNNQIQQYKIILDDLSPQKILEQGYAFVTRDKTTITSSKKTKKDDELLIHFKDGEVKVKVR